MSERHTSTEVVCERMAVHAVRERHTSTKVVCERMVIHAVRESSCMALNGERIVVSVSVAVACSIRRTPRRPSVLDWHMHKR